MLTANFPSNVLYEMDNLEVLRGMNSETVDLIATDPPFNTKRSRSGTAGFYVDNWRWGDTRILPDQWKWNEVHPRWLEEIKDDHSALFQAIESARLCQDENTAAFLCFLSVRLLEMHRILKPTGSIYLHCDATASHYIKMCMDAIWGKKNFRNEIIWRKYSGRKSNATRKFPTQQDSILFYAASDAATFSPVYLPMSEKEISKKYRHVDDDGRRYRLAWGRRYQQTGEQRKIYLDEQPGRMVGTLWIEDGLQLNTSSNERTGSPDQKPLALYERIIAASSNEGDLVLDPFCGCATTIIAAKNLKRDWVGIDRRVDARYHIITRLMGVTRKERERLEKYATDESWLHRQTRKFKFQYSTDPPVRDDNGQNSAPVLDPVYSLRNPHSHAEIKEMLIGKFGVKCWGCNLKPPDDRYLHLDHIIPKSDGGSNDIDNRALLCQPCNSKKSNKISLSRLRQLNLNDGHMQSGRGINLRDALTWTRRIRDEKQRELLELKLKEPRLF